MVNCKAGVITLARDFDLSGFVRDLPDGRVEVIAEGEKDKLERFACALKMKNTLIWAEDVEATYSDASGDYAGFRGLVDLDEICEHLDEGVEILKEILVFLREFFGDLGGKDAALKKQDSMLEKQDSTISEIQGLRYDMKSHMDQRFERRHLGA